jgi:hypothetical protein
VIAERSRSVRRRLLLRRRGDRLGYRQGADLGGELPGVEASTGGGPVLGSELEVAVLGPVGQDAEDVAEVLLGVEPVQARRGDERKEIAGAGSVIVTADEQPRLATHRDLPQLSLGRVVVYAQPTVVEEAHEGVLLANDVAESSSQEASLSAHALVLGLGPRKEGDDLGSAVLVAQSLDLVWRLVTPPRLALVQSADAVDGLASDGALGRNRRLPELSSGVAEAADFGGNSVCRVSSSASAGAGRNRMSNTLLASAWT